MPRTKATLIKKTKVQIAPAAARKADTEEMPIVSGLMKQKVPIEFGYTEALIDDKDVKADDDAAAGAEDAEELAAEELSLDDEEIDPFGDKWEA